MTRYSEEQIRDAIQKAAEKNTPGPVYAWELSMYKKVIDALPEPQDEWEACTIDQIRRGDKVRWQDPVREDTCIHEIIALQTTPEDPGWLLYSRTETYYFPPDAVVDRIPSPVVHPDPAQHPVIVIRDSEHGHDQPAVALWHGGEYKYTDDHGTPQWLLPYQITDWHPIDVAKVAADND